MGEQLLKTPCAFGETGNILLERELGQGGMGGVYMGRDKMLDRPVAVKVMLKEYGSDEEFLGKFRKEAQSAARLIHPNIAQIYSYGVSDGMPYIAMELVAGGSLWSVMQNAPDHRPDVTRVLKICEQTAQALRCAADQGLVHGDVKPENILLDANGNAKLVDFGLAGMQKDTDEIWGTPYYISPEKVRKEPVDFRADMYTLGATLYHALTWTPPFEGSDPVEVVRKRFFELPRKPSEIRPDLTPQVDALVMRMISLKKEDRFPSFEALLEEFKKVLTTGLTPGAAATASGEAPAAEQPAASATTTTTTTGKKKMVVRGRRMMMKKPVKSAAAEEDAGDAGKPEDAEDGEDGENAEGEEGEKKSAKKTLKKRRFGKMKKLPAGDDEDGPSDDDEDEEGGGSVALKVVGVVVGVILLIGGVIGGLVWYQVADKKARVEEHQKQIVDNIAKAREAIADTRKTAGKFADEFDVFTQKAVDSCQKSTDELKKILPDFADMLKPPPSQELLAAIAATNAPAAGAGTSPSPQEMTAASAPAGTNAVAVATNAAPAAAALPGAGTSPSPQGNGAKPAASGAGTSPSPQGNGAKPAASGAGTSPSPQGNGAKPAPAAKAEEPKKEEPKKDIPPVVNDMNDLWNRAYGCLASAVRIRDGVRKILAKCGEADAVTAADEAAMNKLSELSREVVDLFEQLKSSKDVENVKKGITYIKTKGEKAVKQTVERLRVEKLEADRKAKKEAELKAEADRKKAAAEAHAEAAKAEVEEATSKFDALVAAGTIRLLDWKSAERQLGLLKDEAKTVEGGKAAADMLHRVEAMKAVHQLFISQLVNKKNGNYVFRKNIRGDRKKVSLKGCKVTKVDEKTINLVKPDGKSPVTVTWVKFFSEYSGYFNELIGQFVVKGRTNCEPRLGKMKWSEAMLGTALILKTVCAEVPGAPEASEKFVQAAVKDFPDCAPKAKSFFPDLKIESEGEE